LGAWPVLVAILLLSGNIGVVFLANFLAGVVKMADNENDPLESMETVEPIGKRVVIRKDEDKKETKGGIQLPDNIEIPTITGRIVSVSAEVEVSADLPLRQYDKVLFNPKGAIPVDFEGDNRLFVVDIENVVAVFRTT
jgi:chaperonin GroES